MALEVTFPNNGSLQDENAEHVPFKPLPTLCTPMITPRREGEIPSAIVASSLMFSIRYMLKTLRPIFTSCSLIYEDIIQEWRDGQLPDISGRQQTRIPPSAVGPHIYIHQDRLAILTKLFKEIVLPSESQTNIRIAKYWFLSLVQSATIAEHLVELSDRGKMCRDAYLTTLALDKNAWQYMRRYAPFPIMDLPPELRDIIWKFCTSDYRPRTGLVATSYRGTTRASLKRAPWGQLLRCNKQIRENYLASIERLLEVVLIDYYLPGTALLAPPLRIKPCQPLRLEALLLAGCYWCHGNSDHEEECGVDIDLTGHVMWLKKVLQSLNQMRSLHIKIYVSWPARKDLSLRDTPHPFSMLEKLDLFVKLPGITRIEVHRNRSLVASDGLNAKDAKAEIFDLYAIWMECNGWVAGLGCEPAFAEET